MYFSNTILSLSTALIAARHEPQNTTITSSFSSPSTPKAHNCTSLTHTPSAKHTTTVVVTKTRTLTHLLHITSSPDMSSHTVLAPPPGAAEHAQLANQMLSAPGTSSLTTQQWATGGWTPMPSFTLGAGDGVGAFSPAGTQVLRSACLHSGAGSTAGQEESPPARSRASLAGFRYPSMATTTALLDNSDHEPHHDDDGVKDGEGNVSSQGGDYDTTWAGIDNAVLSQMHDHTLGDEEGRLLQSRTRPHVSSPSLYSDSAAMRRVRGI